MTHAELRTLLYQVLKHDAEQRQTIEAKDIAIEFALAAIRDAICLDDGLDGSTGEACCRILVEARERGTFDKAQQADLDIMTAKMREDTETIEAQAQRIRELERELDKQNYDNAHANQTTRITLFEGIKARDMKIQQLQAELAQTKGRIAVDEDSHL